MKSNLAQRVAFALVAIPAALAIVWYGGAALAGLLALAGALGARELLHMARQHGVVPFRSALVLSSAALPVIAWGHVTNPEFRGLIDAWWPYAAAGGLLGILLITLWRRRPDKHPLAAAAVTVFAPLYAGGLLAFAIVIRHARHDLRSWEGAALVFFPLVTVWACDTVAMVAGRRMGGPKLAPTVSPGKTWAGTIGGFLGAIAVAPAYHAAVAQPLQLGVQPWQLLVIAGVLGVMGQLGDLVESLFKREAGFKDSSRLLPGHGGVLDRLDSLYFAVPLSAILYRLFGVI